MPEKVCVHCARAKPKHERVTQIGRFRHRWGVTILKRVLLMEDIPCGGSKATVKTQRIN